MEKKLLGVVASPLVAEWVNGCVVIKRHDLFGKTREELDKLSVAYQLQAEVLIRSAKLETTCRNKSLLYRKAAYAMTKAANIETWINNKMCKETV